MMKLLKAQWGEPLSMRKAYGEALIEIGKARRDVVVLSADVSNSDYSFMFEAVFPERFFNVGIAEPALVDVAAGLANGGQIPIANTFASLFAGRALEQVQTHLCYGQANVKLVGGNGGLSDSFDGPTHHSITDLAIMRSLPNMAVVVPADPLAVRKLLPQVVDWDGPVFFRLCRTDVYTIFEDGYSPKIGKGVLLQPGNDVTIISNGILLPRCIRAVERLAEEGVSTRLIELHTLKPIDSESIEQAARETGAIVTVEEHSIIGGLGSAAAEVVVERFPVPVERVGLKDTFAETGPYEQLLDKYGMSVEDIVAAVKRALQRKNHH